MYEIDHIRPWVNLALNVIEVVLLVGLLVQVRRVIAVMAGTQRETRCALHRLAETLAQHPGVGERGQGWQQIEDVLLRQHKGGAGGVGKRDGDHVGRSPRQERPDR